MVRQIAAFAAAMTFIATGHAQAPTQEQVMRQLPLEGAPLAIAGPYAVAAAAEPAFGAPRLAVYRPTALDAFPSKDKLPVVVWGNGGCLLDTTPFAGYLKTIAAHGFLIVTTAASEGATPPRVTADDLRAAIDWAIAESARRGSPTGGAGFPTTESLAGLHTPTLYLNGSQPDFMFAASRARWLSARRSPASRKKLVRG
jgi:hypothetical protein